MNNLKTTHIWTEDGLELMGFHYDPGNRDVCVLLTHGMAGNFIENDFASILGEELSNNGIGFIYAHNRGYSLINDISTNEKKSDGSAKIKRIGVVYERFEESVFDLDAWYQEVKKLGYKKIIISGHSLGANKVIHYNFKKQPEFDGLILLSPPDMVGNAKEAGKSKVYKELLLEAQKNIIEGNPRKLLSKELWDWYPISSQTFLDIGTDFGPADNLPLMRNSEHFPELESIKAPILAIMGEFDDIAIKTLKEDMDLIAEKSIRTISFTKKFIPGANHGYEGQENILAKEIISWVNNLLT